MTIFTGNHVHFMPLMGFKPAILILIKTKRALFCNYKSTDINASVSVKQR